MSFDLIGPKEMGHAGGDPRSDYEGGQPVALAPRSRFSDAILEMITSIRTM